LAFRENLIRVATLRMQIYRQTRVIMSGLILLRTRHAADKGVQTGMLQTGMLQTGMLQTGMLQTTNGVQKIQTHSLSRITFSPANRSFDEIM